jgi:Asp-tRNA(Asn)/Glu-tRNA(Gln) amidotransferase A subunit family amidase
MYDHAGKVTGCGSKIRAGHVATANASVIDRLQAAGTFSIGRLNMSEFAMGPTGHNHHHGRAINPIDSARITGGSSSGSGAVCRQWGEAGMRALAVATRPISEATSKMSREDESGLCLQVFLLFSDPPKANI